MDEIGAIAPPDTALKEVGLCNDGSVNSRVARLSISQDMETKHEIVAGLSRNDSVLTDVELGSSEKKKKKKKRRRRSSVASQRSASIEPLPVPGVKKKKKKKVDAAARLIILEKALEKNISIKDVRDLILFTFKANNNAPQAFQVENRSNIRKMIVLFAPGLQQQDYDISQDVSFHDHGKILLKKHPIMLKNEDIILNCQSFPVTAPGSRVSLFSAYNSFINVGLSKKEKQDKKEKLSRKKITIHDLVLKLDDLLENNYPIHPATPGFLEEMSLEKDPTGWVNTRTIREDGSSHIFALDCEMCKAEEGLVLTRISVISFEGEVIYNKLVKPDVPILDYLTKYSGITEEKLQRVTTTLTDVQQDLLQIFDQKDILIGHSLQSDLNVLKLRHPLIVDTALIYDHKAGPPFKPALRYLASEYLNQEIQVPVNDPNVGHDSIEDAKACLDLTKMKIVNGLAFGICISTENLFYRLSDTVGIKTLTLNDAGPHSTLSSRSSSIRCVNDEEIFESIKRELDNYEFFVGRLRGLEFAREYAQPLVMKNQSKPSVEESLKCMSEGITDIYSRSPSGTMILMLSGSGDTTDWTKIMADFNKLDRVEKEQVRKQKEEVLVDAVAKARDGVASVIMKE